MTMPDPNTELIQAALAAQARKLQTDAIREWDRRMTRMFKGIVGGSRRDRLRNLEAARRRMEDER
jgi:hypothetical protein